MQCPNCHVDLVMADRSGVEIDYCPRCRGVWLDRGELDKILERANASGHTAQSQQRPHYDERQQYRRDDDDDDYRHNNSSHGHSDNHNKHHKKESFLGDIFDF